MQALTYLVYIVVWDGGILGIFSYAVFWRHENPWWFALAVLLWGSAYSPARWAALWDSTRDRETPSEESAGEEESP